MVYEVDFARGFAYRGTNGYIIQNEGNALYIIDNVFGKIKLTPKNCKLSKKLMIPKQRQKTYNNEEAQVQC